jgi:DNA helicase INO80
MTKMLNILEEVLILKKYSYFRLDGSTDISLRNEMVKNFQERNDIFCFLLSTR